MSGTKANPPDLRLKQPLGARREGLGLCVAEGPQQHVTELASSALRAEE